MSEEKKAEIIKEEIYKAISTNEKKNTQMVVVKIGNSFVTRHMPLDPSRKSQLRRKAFDKSAAAKAEKDERRERKGKKASGEKSTVVEK